MTETTEERQIAREHQQVSLGVERYDKNRANSDETDSGPGAALTRASVEPVAKELARVIEMVEAGKAGRFANSVAAEYLPALEPEPVAYITARCVLNSAGREENLSRVAMRLAQLIEENYTFDQLMGSEEHKGLANTMARKADKWTVGVVRRRIMRKGAQIAGISGLSWADGDRLRLGMKLIEIFMDTTELAYSTTISDGKARNKMVLRLTERAAEYLERVHGKCALMEPVNKPMIHPPRDWTSIVDGGYLTKVMKRDLITGIRPELRDEVLSSMDEDARIAINRIQATPWRINRAVYAVMDEAWVSKSLLGGLPPADPQPIPERPAGIPTDIASEDMPEEMRDRFQDWKAVARAVHNENARCVSQRTALISKLSMAKEVLDEEAIYFPHVADFRGRLYPMTSELSPQADDTGKALLEFAEGKPLGTSGLYWLSVHVANLFGVDKVSFNDRVQWTSDNHDKLMDSAFDPLDGARFWTEADYPYCALAACFEYAGAYASGNPEEYVSHLPIAMDGSCSGLQHFSAMLKDRTGGEAVNLTKRDEPADLYTQVAERTEQLVAESTDPLRNAWMGNVTRKIVKRPCMTFAYSVTTRGMRDQIIDEMRKQAEGGDYLPGVPNFSGGVFLAPLVDQAIRETVSRASEAMDWLRDAVAVHADMEAPVNWHTPDGFVVQQRYMRTNGKRFNVWFNGRRHKVQLRVDTTKADKRKHQSAVAPNFVHSLDACHLRRVVNRLCDEGITTSFAMIHDSFGVHACDVDEMHFAIRDEFIRMYSDNQLELFKAHVEGLMDVELGPVPSDGDLDIEEVRDADFFFA